MPSILKRDRHNKSNRTSQSVPQPVSEGCGNDDLRQRLADVHAALYVLKTV